ncbi:hypothetical protein [Streptomyces marincola]|uniref:PknH-like extracellular domain-containing protein n=1 Tax=Streptomyces marincola TaxID=2878388 RepID=A0A1W7D4N3_9ACTN|nr:hypothetical protein [Streptomyces marincola]ARQ71897.1 hypothetical protein CAG99_26440 [Streptomyces marincola]
MIRRVTAGAVAVLALGAAGCSGNGGGGTDAEPSPGERRTPTAGPSPGGEGPAEADAADRPGPASAADALALARAVAIAPEDFGPGFVAQEPYEPDPATWAVLDDACVWQREPLADGVLANVTRNAELPAERDGDGPLQVMSSVTVYDSVRTADARMADIVEEVLRCPEQRLRADERVTGLGSSSMPPEELSVDDQIYESGQFHSDVHGGPYGYQWLVSRIGPVTVALSVKGSAEFGPDELLGVSAPALALLESNADAELG